MGAEDGMREIGARFCRIGDRIALRHRAPPEPGELREDVPHPVRALGAAPDFGERARIHLLLRCNEPFETFAVTHRASAPCAGGLPKTCVGMKLPSGSHLRTSTAGTRGSTQFAHWSRARGMIWR